MEEEVEDRKAGEANADYAHAHDDAGREGDAEGRVEAGAGLGGRSDVGADGDLHADESGQCRGDGADDVRNRRPRSVRQLAGLVAKAVEHVIVDEDSEDDSDNNDEYCQVGVLATQEGIGPLLDRLGYLLHSVVAFVLGHDRARDHDGEDKRNDARH